MTRITEAERVFLARAEAVAEKKTHACSTLRTATPGLDSRTPARRHLKSYADSENRRKISKNTGCTGGPHRKGQRITGKATDRSNRDPPLCRGEQTCRHRRRKLLHQSR